MQLTWFSDWEASCGKVCGGGWWAVARGLYTWKHTRPILQTQLTHTHLGASNFYVSRVGRTDRILLPPSIKNKNNKISPTCKCLRFALYTHTVRSSVRSSKARSPMETRLRSFSKTLRAQTRVGNIMWEFYVRTQMQCLKTCQLKRASRFGRCK